MSSSASGPAPFVWRDGRIIPYAEATLHVMSHAVHYGSAMFEGIRCYPTPAGPAAFRLPEHMRRLADSCRIYGIPLGYTVEQLCRAAVETVAANRLDACYLRPLVARTGEQMGIHADDRFVEVFMIPWVWGTYLGEGALENGVDTCVSSWRRAAPDTFPTQAKAAGAYLNSQLAKAEARARGVSEAILLDAAGYLSEGSGQNLFLVRDGVLLTPPLSSGILAGITRDAIIRLARADGIEVREVTLQREQLYTADEAFFTGTAAELTPIRSVDGVPVGAGRRGPVTQALQERFQGIAHGRLPDPFGWLTPIPAPVPQER